MWANGQHPDAPGKKDATSLLVIQQGIELAQAEQRAAEREALADIDDRATREAVKKHLANERKAGRDIDVQGAQAEVEAANADKYKAEIADLNERLRAAEEQTKPNGTAPPTHHRDTPASTVKTKPMTAGEYEDAKRGLSTFERLKLEEQVDRGEIRIRG